MVFEAEHKPLNKRGLELLGKYMITRILGLDYADNIVVIAHKSSLT